MPSGELTPPVSVTGLAVEEPAPVAFTLGGHGEVDLNEVPGGSMGHMTDMVLK